MRFSKDVCKVGSGGIYPYSCNLLIMTFLIRTKEGSQHRYPVKRLLHARLALSFQRASLGREALQGGKGPREGGKGPREGGREGRR